VLRGLKEKMIMLPDFLSARKLFREKNERKDYPT
jgi:hypothetical protein